MVCNQCGYNYSQFCQNPGCSENPANYPTMISRDKDGTCTAPNCNICLANRSLSANIAAKCFCGICNECIAQVTKEIKDAEEKKWQTPAQAKCECGSEIASGANARHSAWCPKFAAVE